MKVLRASSRLDPPADKVGLGTNTQLLNMNRLVMHRDDLLIRQKKGVIRLFGESGLLGISLEVQRLWRDTRQI